MGQYYHVAAKIGNEKAFVNEREIKNHGYIMAKLLEHSYMRNPLCLCVAKLLSENKARIAWIGDYAKDDEIVKITNGELNYKAVWDANAKHVFDEVEEFDWSGLALVNHTKKEFVDIDEYARKSDDDGWCICPIPLLTAIGNDRGGGDYRRSGTCYSLVGTWAWDELQLVQSKSVPDGFKKLDVYFRERR
jgi:hypothetical protein